MGEFILNVLAGLIAGVLGTIAVVARNRIMFSLRVSSIRKLWLPFLKEDTVVILTGRPGSLPRSTTKVSFVEVRALETLEGFYKSVGGKFKLANSLDTPLTSHIDCHVILLGGRRANEVTELASKKIAIPFAYDGKGNLLVHGEIFPTVPDDGSVIKEDHAIVLKCESPFGRGKKILMLAGNHGAATEAAVQYAVSSKGIAQIASRIGIDDFLAILHTRIEDNVPREVTLVKCWRFEEIKP